MSKALYWVIKTEDAYWLEEGGVTPIQKKAERFKTKDAATHDLEKWCDQFWRNRPVKVVRRRATG